MYATSCYSPGMYFPPFAPHVLSHCTVMYTPTGPPRCTPNSLSPAGSVPRTTPVSEYSQSSHGSPSDTYVDRPGSVASQLAEMQLLFDPYYRQHQDQASIWDLTYTLQPRSCAMSHLIPPALTPHTPGKVMA